DDYPGALHETVGIQGDARRSPLRHERQSDIRWLDQFLKQLAEPLDQRSRRIKEMANFIKRQGCRRATLGGPATEGWSFAPCDPRLGGENPCNRRLRPQHNALGMGNLLAAQRALEIGGVGERL